MILYLYRMYIYIYIYIYVYTSYNRGPNCDQGPFRAKQVIGSRRPIHPVSGSKLFSKASAPGVGEWGGS